MILKAVRNKPWFVVWSFFFYTAIWDCGIIAAFLWYILVKGHSMFYLLVALALTSLSYKPWHWHSLVTGIEPKSED